MRRSAWLFALLLGALPARVVAEPVLTFCLENAGAEAAAAAALDRWLSTVAVALAEPPCAGQTGYRGTFVSSEGQVRFRLAGMNGPALERAVPWLAQTSRPLSTLEQSGRLNEFSVLAEGLLAEHRLAAAWERREPEPAAVQGGKPASQGKRPSAAELRRELQRKRLGEARQQKPAQRSGAAAGSRPNPKAAGTGASSAAGGASAAGASAAGGAAAELAAAAGASTSGASSELAAAGSPAQGAAGAIAPSAAAGASAGIAGENTASAASFSEQVNGATQAARHAAPTDTQTIPAPSPAAPPRAGPANPPGPAIDFQAPADAGWDLRFGAGSALRFRSPGITSPEIALGVELGPLFARGLWQPRTAWEMGGLPIEIEGWGLQAGLHSSLVSGRLLDLRAEAGIAVERLTLLPMYGGEATTVRNWDAGPLLGARLGWVPVGELELALAAAALWMPTARESHLGPNGPSARINAFGGRVGLEILWPR